MFSSQLYSHVSCNMIIPFIFDNYSITGPHVLMFLQLKDKSLIRSHLDMSIFFFTTGVVYLLKRLNIGCWYVVCHGVQRHT